MLQIIMEQRNHFKGNKLKGLMLCCVFFSLSIDAQQIISLKQAIDSSLKRSPQVQVAALQTLQSRQLQKSSVNLDNPEVLAESPTGDFYTIGVQQSFDFPGTYIRQHQYQEEQTKLAAIGKTISEIDVKREISRLYLDLQYRQAELALFKKQDSLYNAVSLSAARQFTAGTIDFLQKIYAESQYGQAHLQYEQARTEYTALQEQLSLFTGIAPPYRVDSLAASFIRERIDFSLSANPYIGYFNQQLLVNRRLLQVERNRFMPGFMFGYLNQGPMSTPLTYRFRMGITVPLWFWQYNGRIQAARTGIRITEQQNAAQVQQISSQLINARAEQTKSTTALLYYEGTGLKQAQGIEDAASRFFKGGETDYATYLRTLNDAYTIRLKHIEAVRSYNMSVIQLNYLSGKL